MLRKGRDVIGFHLQMSGGKSINLFVGGAATFQKESPIFDRLSLS